MKVNIDQTVQISDEQRVQLANVLDGRVTKRQATRDEMKDYIWTCGKNWEDILARSLGLTGDDTTVVEDEADEEDLLGDAEDEDLLGDVDDEDDLI